MRQCQYVVLKKKLSQLKSLIKSLSSPSHSAAEAHEIAGRIAFLKNLLTAEMESSATGTRKHLHRIANQLALLDEAFRNWAEFGALGEDDGLDAGPLGSCTDACFGDGEEQGQVGDGEETMQRRFRGRNYGIIGLAVVAMAAAAVGAVKTLYVAEHKDFLVPT